MNAIYGIFYVILWFYVLKILQERHNSPLLKKKTKEDPELLIKCIWCLQIGEIQKIIPKYKFFSELVEELVSIKKNFGGDISSQLNELRQNIRIDQKMSKKVGHLLGSAIYQYLVMAIFVICFLFLAQKMISLEVPPFSYALLALYLLLGVLSIFFIFIQLKKYCFSHINIYLKKIYIFSNAMSLKIPFSIAIKKASIESLPVDKNLNYLKLRIEKIIENINLLGSVSKEEFNLLISEGWDHYELQCEKFEKMVSGMKLLLMGVFILPSFLGVIYLIMASMVF